MIYNLCCFLSGLGRFTSIKSRFASLFCGESLDYVFTFLNGATLYKFARHEWAIILLESTDIASIFLGDLIGGKKVALLLLSWSRSRFSIIIYSFFILLTIDSKSSTLWLFFLSNTDPEWYSLILIVFFEAFGEI